MSDSLSTNKLLGLMTYRVWITYSFFILGFVEAAIVGFIFTELSTSGIINYTPALTIGLVVVSTLMACIIAFGFINDARIKRVRTKVIEEALVHDELGGDSLSQPNSV